jgi:hypothetical protein
MGTGSPHEARGQIKEILLVTQYPDGQIRVGRVNAQKVKRILLDPDECKAALPPGHWNTGNPNHNPGCVLIQKDAQGNETALGSCTPNDHPPPWN